MANRKILKFGALLMAVSMLPISAYTADANWYMEGTGEITKANESVNTNPWNQASIAAGGANGYVELVTVWGGVIANLDAPLYKLSDDYSDKIIEKDGVWGVERNVTAVVFDGSEDWEIYKQAGYQNSNTIIFTCTATEDYAIQNGINTHFDVVLDSEQKNRVYDGISFGREQGTILMRFMKVRGVNSVESLKSYLKGQYDAGNPVTLLYPAVETTFVPFDDEVQEKLKNTEVMGYRDSGSLRFGQDNIELSTEIFINENTGNDDLDRFLCGVSDIRILHANEDEKYFIEGIYPAEDGVTVKAESLSGAVYSGTLYYNEQDFLTSQLTELALKGDDDTEIRLRINLYEVKVPSSTVSGFTYDETGMTEDCVKSAALVLPEYICIAENMKTPFYAENSLIYDNSTEVAAAGSVDENGAYLTVTAGELEETVEIITPAENRERINIMFLGDSLINQDYYTEAVAELFEDDSIKLSFIGTRGSGEEKHEGRGGWSAYDYCNSSSKYGYFNPFLNDGEFDFEYYMDTNGFDGVDIVVLNLGINDLNLLEHNGHDEIMGYFSEIIDSIHDYDENIKVLVNIPTLTYNSEENEAYRYDRLAFAESLYDSLGGKEDEGIILVPLYLSVDPTMSYKYTEPVIDEFNQDYGMLVTDATHPSIAGYRQMAEMTYSYIKLAVAMK